MAWRTNGRYGIVLEPSTPQLAVRTTVGFADSIRFAHSAGAKPPKTTTWTAPMCVLASMAKIASGIMGTGRTSARASTSETGRRAVNQDPLPCSDPQILQHSGECLNLSLQLAVRDPPFPAGDRRVPHECRL